MAVLSYSVPDEVKEAFERACAGEDPAAVLTALMRQAAEERSRDAEAAARRREAVEAVLKGQG